MLLSLSSLSKAYQVNIRQTHSSIQGYETTSYERLEFIGDAILDFSKSLVKSVRVLLKTELVVIRHIFDRDQQLSPGALTLLKARFFLLRP